MKLVRSVFDFYLQSSIHVALAVTSMAVITVFEIGFVPEPTVLIFIFLGTIVGYNFVKYAGISNIHHLKITPNINLIRVFTLFCLLGLIYFSLMLPFDVLKTASVFAGFTILYALPLYKSRNLRSLSGAKIYIIALVWMGAAVLVPLEYHNLRFNMKIFYQCLEIFLFVIALTLPFEIRDLKYDESGLGTIPQKSGVQKTKWLGTILLIIAAVISFQPSYINESHLPISWVIYLITLALLWGTKEEQGNYYTSFWVESIPILWLVVILNF